MTVNYVKGSDIKTGTLASLDTYIGGNPKHICI